MVLPTVETPDVFVNDRFDVLSVSVKVLPAAPNDPPVPMARFLAALTVVDPANALLSPVKVSVPAPA